MEKRGQFYLIATMIIVSITVGLVVVSNYSRGGNSIKLYDLGEELRIESEKFLDDISARGGDYSEIHDFTEEFDAYAGDDVEIYYITGTVGNIEAYKYVNNVKTPVTPPSPIVGEGKIIIQLEDEYKFELKSGVNFYFIMVQEVEGERYVVTN